MNVVGASDTLQAVPLSHGLFASNTVSNQASTITISWGADGQLQIAVKDGGTYSCAADESAIKSILERIGFVVTPKTQYCMKWDLRNADGTVPPLAGGGQVQKIVYCANKDTFMLLNNDVETQHPSSSLSAYNYAYGKDSVGENLAKDYISVYLAREFTLSKNWTMNGEAIGSETTIRDGDILDYTLNVSHTVSRTRMRLSLFA